MRTLVLLALVSSLVFAQEGADDLAEEMTAGEALDPPTCRILVADIQRRIEGFTRLRFRRPVPVLVEPKGTWESRVERGGMNAISGLAFYNIVNNSITIVPWTIGRYIGGRPQKHTKARWLAVLESILIHELTHAVHHQNFYVILGGARQASMKKDGLTEEEIDESTVEFLLAEGYAELVAHRTATPDGRKFLNRTPRDQISGPLFFWERYQPDGVAPYRMKLSRFGYQDGMNILHILSRQLGSRGVRSLIYRQPPRELFFQPQELATLELDDPPEPDAVLGILAPDVLAGGAIYLAVNPGPGRFFPEGVRGTQRSRAPGCLLGYATEVGEEDDPHGRSRYAFFIADPDNPGTWSKEQADSLRALGSPAKESKATLPMERAKAQLVTVLAHGGRYVRAEHEGLVIVAHETKPTPNLEERVLLALRALYIRKPTKGIYAAAAAAARKKLGK